MRIYGHIISAAERMVPIIQVRMVKRMLYMQKITKYILQVKGKAIPLQA